LDLWEQAGRKKTGSWWKYRLVVVNQALRSGWCKWNKNGKIEDYL
jgi:hypothetical protein